MLQIDVAAIHFMNAYAGVSRGFDTFEMAFAYNGLLKVGPLLISFWALWFAPNPTDPQQRHARLVSAVVASCFAAVISVGLTHILPSRPRPIIDPQLGFVLPYGMHPEGWDRSSSLPSDHAAMFFALAAGMWFVSRLWGGLALLFVLLFIAVPRAYLGLHYVSDLAAGGAIGVALAWIGNTRPGLRVFSQHAMTMQSRRPDIFYPAMILITYQIADLFWDARQLLNLMKQVVHGTW